MPEIALASGQVVVLDAEDYGWAVGHTWRLWRPRPVIRWIVVADATRSGKRYRLRLHREIALRMRPDLMNRRLRVLLNNGDPLDCRRANLEVVVSKQPVRSIGRNRKRPPFADRGRRV